MIKMFACFDFNGKPWIIQYKYQSIFNDTEIYLMHKVDILWEDQLVKFNEVILI